MRAAGWEIPIPILIMGGIYGGFYTAAAVAAAYVFLIEVFVYRDLDLRRDVPRIARESMMLVGVILIILEASLGLTNYLVDQQVPMRLLEAMRTLLIVGCLMDVFSAIIVVVPLIVPVAREFGVHPVHPGVIFLTNLEIGYMTPPSCSTSASRATASTSPSARSGAPPSPSWSGASSPSSSSPTSRPSAWHRCAGSPAAGLEGGGRPPPLNAPPLRRSPLPDMLAPCDFPPAQARAGMATGNKRILRSVIRMSPARRYGLSAEAASRCAAVPGVSAFSIPDCTGECIHGKSGAGPVHRPA